MQQIGKNQFVILMMLYIIGGTPLYELGSQVHQDAWLAVTLSALLGVLVTAVYIKLYSRAPAAGLGELYVMHFGQWLGKAVALLYVLWFSYEAMLNIRGVGELTSVALLPATPVPFIMAIFLGAAAFTVHKGVEVFARVAQLLMPIVVFSYSLLVLLIVIARLPVVHRLLPVMEHGLAPVAYASFTDLIAFPFSQFIVMLVFCKYVGDKTRLGGATVRAQIIVSVFLILMNMLTMCVLGPELSALSVLPLLEVVQLIRLANFLERLDILVTLLLFIGLYVKLTLLYFAAVLTLGFVTGAKSHTLVAPVGAGIYALTLTIPSISYFIWLSHDHTLRLEPLFQIAIPVVMLVIGVRKKYRKVGAVAKDARA